MVMKEALLAVVTSFCSFYRASRVPVVTKVGYPGGFGEGKSLTLEVISAG